jgi:cytoskeletal protein RodZ
MANKKGGAPRVNSTNDVAELDLRKSRLDKGVTLEDIAERTKISIRFLRAIEAEEFETLPGGIFATSYLRQYAESIEIDAARLIGLYRSKTAGVIETEEAHVQVPQSKLSLLRFWSTAAGR